MVRIKPLDKISSKYVKRAAVAGPDWKDETLANAEHWIDKATTDISEDNYAAGTAAASERKARQNVLKRKGTEKYKRNVEKKGQTNYTTGVKVAEKDHKDGFSPFYDTLSALKVSERGPAGAPGNYDIVREVGEALREKKEALQAAGA